MKENNQEKILVYTWNTGSITGDITGYSDSIEKLYNFINVRLDNSTNTELVVFNFQEIQITNLHINDYINRDDFVLINENYSNTCYGQWSYGLITLVYKNKKYNKNFKVIQNKICNPFTDIINPLKKGSGAKGAIFTQIEQINGKIQFCILNIHAPFGKKLEIYNEFFELLKKNNVLKQYSDYTKFILVGDINSRSYPLDREKNNTHFFTIKNARDNDFKYSSNILIENNGNLSLINNNENLIKLLYDNDLINWFKNEIPLLQNFNDVFLEKNNINKSKNNYHTYPNHLPSYKIDPETGNYVFITTDNKKRVPGYADRIMISNDSIFLCINYGMLNDVGSDHFPIYAEFEIN